MPQDDNDQESRMLSQQAYVDHPDSDLAPQEGIGLELSIVANERGSASTDYASLNLPPLAFKKTQTQRMFATQIWHRFYAVALLETDPAKLAATITLAEEAILNRYVDLLIAQVQTDETVDLQHAVAILSQLKEANAIGRMSQEFVA
jgi:hypothetical protein